MFFFKCTLMKLFQPAYFVHCLHIFVQFAHFSFWLFSLYSILACVQISHVSPKILNICAPLVEWVKYLCPILDWAEYLCIICRPSWVFVHNFGLSWICVHNSYQAQFFLPQLHFSALQNFFSMWPFFQMFRRTVHSWQVYEATPETGLLCSHLISILLVLVESDF